MFSHITVGVSDLDAAAAFYDAILLPLGLRQREVTPDDGPAARCWIIPGQTLPRFYAYQPFDRRPASAGNGSMVAFLAADEQQVRQAYAAGMQAGGRPVNARTTAKAILAPICAIPTAIRFTWFIAVT
ncbi:Uncharacterised protein [Serratia entomophila]|uniref:VOC family protein n=1 Tax=Serratia entomophila TaxID=42906 RepID=UPI00217BC7B0|nr:VOC family protein [Serratia entomophila]CAI0897851.1 Uncharacterised protein [Serratia entomophila]CAI0933733.1 Uncharacterised protein [Serratia entomophila]CAI2090092.1 Uncharacterised protein [Serratia entomophila]